MKKTKQEFSDDLPNRSETITGQLIFRETSQLCDRMDGTKRKLMMVVGIIAVPLDTELQGEHQYPVYGIEEKIVIAKDHGVDMSSETIGSSLGSLVMKSIWRI
jgi:hypothetical protein